MKWIANAVAGLGLGGLALLLGSCETASPGEIRVFGEIRAPGLPTGPAALVTMPGAAGGVMLSTDIGGGRRALTLTRENTAKVITLMRATLDDWGDLRDEPSFSRTLMIAAATSDRVNPFSLQVVKPPGVKEPVFLLAVAYYESMAYLALDRENAENWIKVLRGAAG